MFTQFATNEPVTVKIINVLSGHRTSLQAHKHRDEYWYVVDGKLMVFVDTETRILNPGETCTVPKNTKHRMIGITDTRVLEISRGDFDENDIQRFQDDYSRA